MPSTRIDEEEQLIEEVAGFTRDPLGFVYYAFPWGQPGELEEHDGPDEWQIKVLEEVGKSLQADPWQAIREAVASGHGVGKSSLCAWLVLWAMSTCPDTRGVVTASTDTQLRTKTWAEMSKWHRLFIAKHWFKLTATALHSIDPEHERTWRVDIIPWSEHNTEAFAGTHNQGSRIVIIFDESSSISDKIWEVTEGVLTDKETEIMWFAFGNPTRTNGRFRECFRKFKHRWKRHQVDSRKCKMTNKKEIAGWEEDYGEDSDFFKVRVRGEFPNVSAKQFISSDSVDEARKRKVLTTDVQYAPKIIGVDPSWSGDDPFTIWFRQGTYLKKLASYPKNDDDFEMAGRIAAFEDEYEADAVFVDFGYGTGIVSAGKQLKRKWILVPFGGASNRPDCLNKRMEIWQSLKEWILDGGALPDDPDLAEQLTSPELIPITKGKNMGKKQLESKELMKKRGVPSPNDADAVALTFSFTVKPKNERQGRGKLEFANSGQQYRAFGSNKKTVRKKYRAL
jgi:hypothetical protein